MKQHRLKRGDSIREGLVLTRGVGPMQKGRALTADDVRALADLPWTELPAIELEAGDVHEAEAGKRIATAAAGEGIEVKPMDGGSFPLAAKVPGLLEVAAEPMAQVNLVADLAMYTHPRDYVATAGDVVGRVKVVPFVTREDRVAKAESLARGAVRIRPFVPLRCSLLVQEALAEDALDRARASFSAKLGFFGSELSTARLVPASAEGLAQALREEREAGTRVIVVAGSRSMDPSDPVLGALPAAGAAMVKHGVPVYPGTLLWVAQMGDAAIIGAPSCGIFSKVSSLDVVLPRIMTGARISAEELSALSLGGLIAPEVSYRLPPYKKGLPRGQLE
jgi:molybdopterin biosynthesis enzyme